MGGAREGKSNEKQKHGPPREPRNFAIISKLRTLNGGGDKAPTPEKKDDTEHRLNEALLVKWTRRLAVFTIVLAVAGVVADGISVVTLVVTSADASQQATDTQKALGIAGSQASAAADQAAAGAAQASAAGDQAEAAQKSADTARQEMVANSRAWVGPGNGVLVATPLLGSELNITIQYQNTGREPATDALIDVHSIVAPDGEGMVDNIKTYAASCLATGGGNQVVFPTVEFGSGYEAHTSIDGPKVAQAVIDGHDWVWAYGCFVYSTLKEIHRSSFCYYFQNSPSTKSLNMSICGVGQHAD